MAGCWSEAMKIITFQDLLNAKFQYEIMTGQKKDKHPGIYVTEPIIGQNSIKLYTEYITNCYDKNKNQKCHKEMNGYTFCKICPKAKKKKNKKQNE